MLFLWTCSFLTWKRALRFFTSLLTNTGENGFNRHFENLIINGEKVDKKLLVIEWNPVNILQVDIQMLFYHYFLFNFIFSYLFLITFIWPNLDLYIAVWRTLFLPVHIFQILVEAILFRCQLLPVLTRWLGYVWAVNIASVCSPPLKTGQEQRAL